ncbi:MAG TPA: hypothetical protein DCS93_11960 [Microscillaceae bacterium]|nr:hypothetical protein [Microscillaceae bacterium]
MNKFFLHFIGWVCLTGLSMISFALQAQEINYGIKVGTNINQFKSPHAQWASRQWTPRPVVGMYLQSHHETSGFFIQQEVLFSQKSGRLALVNHQEGQNQTIGGNVQPSQEIRRTIHFIDVPLIIGKEIFDQKAALYAGTMISYPIFAQQQGGTPEDDAHYNPQVLNTLIVYQLGLQLKVGKKMRLDIRYERNLWNLGFVLPSGHRVDDQMHNIQVALQWDLFSDREDVFQFNK